MNRDHSPVDNGYFYLFLLEKNSILRLIMNLPNDQRGLVVALLTVTLLVVAVIILVFLRVKSILP